MMLHLASGIWSIYRYRGTRLLYNGAWPGLGPRAKRCELWASQLHLSKSKPEWRTEWDQRHTATQSYRRLFTLRLVALLWAKMWLDQKRPWLPVRGKSVHNHNRRSRHRHLSSTAGLLLVLSCCLFCLVAVLCTARCRHRCRQPPPALPD